MKKVGGLFICSALALMAFAALPLSAAELSHRWSFNGDYSDSVGGGFCGDPCGGENFE